ncbi:MAG: hypothetical protein ACLPND_17825 [Candidatus Korobacteraceae bacterium]
MPNVHKLDLLCKLEERFGKIKRLAGSQSLFSVGEDAARIYVRYSKIHERRRTFFGLRDVDLRQLEGRNSYICFLSDGDSQPVFLPYADYEEVFRGAQTAADGQYKVQLLNTRDERELYVARQGRFNVEGYVGFEVLDRGITTAPGRVIDLTHGQVQMLLAGIGNLKGYDVCVPAYDAARLEWSLTRRFNLRPTIPFGYEGVAHILSEVDVIWVARGRDVISDLFEVEHSTPIYSGLLRFNDLLLTNPRLSHFSIVSNDSRRALFARQLFRPTFQRSGLAELTSFLEYANVSDWHSRLFGSNRDQTSQPASGV